jgi:hypothetical protein
MPVNVHQLLGTKYRAKPRRLLNVSMALFATAWNCGSGRAATPSSGSIATNPISAARTWRRSGRVRSSLRSLTATDSLIETRRLKAIENLWGILRGLNKEFGDLRYVHTILTPEELDTFSKNGWPEKFYIKHYSLDQTIVQKMQDAGCDDADKERPFVTPRLWGVFFTIRAIYGRLAYLCQRSFKERKLVDWRTDSGIDQLLRTQLPAHVIDSVKSTPFHGTSYVIDHLEIQFMNAAGMNPT